MLLRLSQDAGAAAEVGRLLLLVRVIHQQRVEYARSEGTSLFHVTIKQ